MRHIPRKSRTVVAALLAIAVHVGLILFLVFGVSWQNRHPESMEVEIVQPLAKAPEPPPKPIEPKPKPPEPPPPKPEPPKPEPPKIEPPPPPVVKAEPTKADIALKAKKEKERLEKIEKERLEQERIDKEKIEKQKREQDRLAQEKRERELRDAAQREAAKRELAQRDAVRREAELRNIEEMKLAQARAQQEAEDRVRREAQLAQERVVKQQQDAQRAAAARALNDYIAKIQAKIRGNVILPPEITGNPEAQFDVVQLPTGEVMSAEIRRSSGSRAYDDAVLRAILKSSPLPKPDQNDLFQRNLVLKFRPRE